MSPQRATHPAVLLLCSIIQDLKDLKDQWSVSVGSILIVTRPHSFRSVTETFSVQSHIDLIHYEPVGVTLKESIVHIVALRAALKT